jgi:probable HAF family extracellular repeat protein
MALAVLASVLLLSVIVGNAWGAVQYTVMDLGLFSEADGINDSGQVVGQAAIGPSWKAFRTAANQPINPATDNLGTLGGAGGEALGINAGGQVVGFADISSGAAAFHAFFYDGSGPMTDLGTFGGTYSEGCAINDSGRIVGEADGSDGRQHAFSHAGGGPLNLATDDLGTLGQNGNCSANGINDSGQVVGVASAPNGDHAFRTAANQPINPATDDLGTLGGTWSCAYGINDSGQVVGDAFTSSGAAHAFLYNGGGPMQDLNNLIASASGWTLTVAVGINESGQIACTGTDSSGRDHALLLTLVPEPSTIALLLAGAVGLLGYGWQRRRLRQLASVITAF